MPASPLGPALLISLLLSATVALAASPSPPAPPTSPTTAAAPRLAWPLAFNDGLAASFGELRGDRLHTGLDLRTRGETGFPVHAAAAGRVVRMKEEWRGYGLAVYVEHTGGHTGLTTVYAHLDHVASDLERRLAAARSTRGGHWAGDVEVKPGRAVASGEVFAWSGESGAGLPHLHFEVREGMGRPVDPFAAGLVPPAGSESNEPPVAEELVVEPAAVPGAVAEGSTDPLVLKLERHGEVYASAGRPVLRGPFRLYLRAYDRAGADNHTGLGGLRVSLDGRERYRLRFDGISFAENFSSGAVLDLARSHSSPTFYTYRLSAFEGAKLSFSLGADGTAGLLDPEPGDHRVEIELTGIVTTLGPRARVRFDFKSEIAPPLTLRERSAAAAPPLAALEVWPRGTGLALAARAAGDGDPLAALDRALGVEVAAGPARGDLVLAWAAAVNAVVEVGDSQRVTLLAATVGHPVRLAAGAAELRLAGSEIYADVALAARVVEGSFPDGLVAMAPPVSFLPDAHPLRAPAEIVFAVEASGPRSGVYRLDRVDGSWDLENMGNVARVRRLGTYALLDDRAPPVIESVATRREGGSWLVEARVRDLGSGIPEHGVLLWLGDVPLDVYYDPDRALARARSSSPPKGPLRVRVEDRAGNAVERTTQTGGKDTIRR